MKNENPNWERDSRMADITADQRKIGSMLKEKRSLESYHPQRKKAGLGGCLSVITLIALVAVLATLI